MLLIAVEVSQNVEFLCLSWNFSLKLGKKHTFCHWEHGPISVVKMDKIQPGVYLLLKIEEMILKCSSKSGGYDVRIPKWSGCIILLPHRQ